MNRQCASSVLEILYVLFLCKADGGQVEGAVVHCLGSGLIADRVTTLSSLGLCDSGEERSLAST
jgi:hypothetical protein